MHYAFLQQCAILLEFDHLYLRWRIHFFLLFHGCFLLCCCIRDCLTVGFYVFYINYCVDASRGGFAQAQ